MRTENAGPGVLSQVYCSFGERKRYTVFSHRWMKDKRALQVMYVLLKSLSALCGEPFWWLLA
jgi:hypothetical protein